MSKKNDGGPAFPDAVAVSPSGGVYYGTSAGMSLRDWFAGQALAGLCTSNPGYAAKQAYQHADAMIAERDKC